MNAKVGFNEVQNYAKTHNVDFKTAAQKLGLTAQEAADLERLGGAPDAPEDGFQRKPAHSYTLKSGRKVNVYKDASGKQTFEYLAADGTKLNEAYFLKQEGLTGSRFVVMGNGQLGTVKNPEQQQKKEEETSWWSKAGNFIKENATGIVAGTAVVAGAICCATGVGASVGVPLLLVGGAIGLSSCTAEDPTEFNTNINVSISIPPNDQSALIEAFKEGIDALLAKMDELGYKVEQYGDQIIKLLTDNNAYLKDISENLKEQGYKQDEIIELLTNINSTVQTIETLVEATNENIVINGQNVNAKLEEILNAIKNGQASSMEALEAYMEELRQLLLDVIENQREEININEENGMTLDQIYEVLVNMDGMTGDKLEQLLKILQSIESIGKDINNKLDVIIGKFEDSFPDNSEILEALNRIEEYLKQNNDKTDVTNNLLEQLLNQYNSGGISKEDLQKLLDAIAANGDKIDATNQLLAKIQQQDAEFQKQVLAILANVGTEYSDVLNKILEATQGNSAKLDAIAQLLAKIQEQDEKFQKNILDAINQLGIDITEQLNNILDVINNISGGGGDSSNIEDLLNKVLEKMDSNTAAIIDAIGNIKPGEGGTVDLSSVEKMLKELIELTAKNNDLLENINAKVEVISVTQQAILEKINSFENMGCDTSKLESLLEEILDKMGQQSGSYDDSKLLEILNNLTAKFEEYSKLTKDQLDKILEAIKDHDVNVTVDVTGKVTCECNCGGNHEGILGDLEDILG